MPDLNSVPASPRFLASTLRRASSQQMPPPPTPGDSSLNILPSNQSTVNASSSSSLPSPAVTATAPFPGPPMSDNTGVGPGPGPMRHPRPMTAADLHLELEKEQEAVVNRLTRELSILRAAQNASVASNASSTSASASGTEPGQWADTASPLGINTYQPIRHHRTSSSTSARSLTANAGSVTASLAGGISSPAPIRPTAQPPIPIPITGASSLSRQNSSASHRGSRAGSRSPAPRSISGSYTGHHASEPGSLPGYFNSRMPIRSQSGTSTSAAATPASVATTSELSPGILPATSRYEETALRRAELEEVKRENEALRRRVRELERLVRDAALAKQDEEQDSTASTSGSAPSRTAGGGGSSVAGAGSSAQSAVGAGVPEEEVGVGESAASGGW